MSHGFVKTANSFKIIQVQQKGTPNSMTGIYQVSSLLNLGNLVTSQFHTQIGYFREDKNW